MSKLLVDDRFRFYGSMEMQEVLVAFEQGIRHSDSGGLVNVRNWNIWLKEYKAKANLKRQQRQLTDYQRDRDSQKMIGETINKAKRLK